MSASVSLSSLPARLSQTAPREIWTPGAPPRALAAVAAVLREGADGIEVLLIRRAEREGDPWSGQMALPGGRHDATDRDLLHTALRETEEELGVTLSPSQLVAPLDDLEAIAHGRRTGMVIRPYVFTQTTPLPPLRVPNREVAEVVWTPLAPLFDGTSDTAFPYRMGDTVWDLPAWKVQQHIVWGLTHRIVSNLLTRIFTS